ncbi:unnamed protein product [Adineta steineri]|uniref:FAD-binding domain-containing protein n=2 Tax=Adineta steineri TaxID=433720 RepID=A0A819MQG4_9BILA|nr:unnamed protein product [Adineta steineri]
MLTNNLKRHSPTIAIIGGGLGGSLCACFFAKHDFQVHLFELRPDIRTQKTVKGRSINMALSRRGHDSLAYINCAEMIANTGVPLYARMMHDENGHTCAFPYGPYEKDPNHMILSVERDALSKCLLDEASKSSNITIHFEHKFISWNRDTKEALFCTSSGTQVKFNVDFIIGFDGSYSSVRAAMMKTEKINLTQEYLDLYYMEINIPAKDGQFAMPENYLHIWPRHKFVIIASPNQDKSFNATLILPISMFDSLSTSEEVLQFFQQYFPDVLSFIGSDEIIKTFRSSTPRPLITIKCSTYVSSAGDMLLMGDAAHSMAPFYAQGMNAAFEDCLVLFETLKQTNFDFQKAFIAYK